MTDTISNAPAWLQCDGKEPFNSPQVAAKVARRRTAARKRGGQQDRPLISYRCPHCRLFHVGGMGKR